MSNGKKEVVDEVLLSLVSEPQLSYSSASCEGQWIYDDHYLYRIAREGIPFQVFERMTAAYPFTGQDWAGFLQLPYRTFNRYKAENRIFQGHFAERILEVVRFMEKGRRFFNRDQDFFTWLQLPAYGLGQERPDAYLDSSFGIELVADYLGQMEHGILA